MESTERRFSLREAAEALGISEITARRWVKSGKLRARQPGRSYQIPESAVEELLSNSPKEPEPLTLEWARSASDADFYRLIVTAPEEDIDRLSELSKEMSGFTTRQLRRVMAERSDRPFTDHGPEPEPGEYQTIKARSEALASEVKRRCPPFARVRVSVRGNECLWLIPPDQWEVRREQVDEFFGGERYSDMDARGEVPLHEEDAALA